MQMLQERARLQAWKPAGRCDCPLTALITDLNVLLQTLDTTAQNSRGATGDIGRAYSLSANEIRRIIIKHSEE
jgi:hypothetical protein